MLLIPLLPASQITGPPDGNDAWPHLQTPALAYRPSLSAAENPASCLQLGIGGPGARAANQG